ncbi:YtxH domain-containing protein [Ohtaekwangia koreensis]|jgi:gas vesicle protein|uniref:Gas vesicle protein n=1 Tax=Ohtaekwangia koreensis TaxID=688867 RepID=A0A1T5IPR1_9BACT|nr:YtxH domain-containing protein [Ohtaekwangia koreensis]SKC41105.1 Gas vesicle protein [Ohtaekwangia koreensis]
MNSTSKVIVGILGAAAAGVIVGMLIAPEKGEDLRKNIKKTTDDWLDDVAQWMGKGKSFLSEMKDRASEEVEDATSEASQGINGLKENLGRRKQ